MRVFELLSCGAHHRGAFYAKLPFSRVPTHQIVGLATSNALWETPMTNQFKASGKFDEARTQALSDFKASEQRVNLENAVTKLVDRAVREDPNLLRDRSEGLASLMALVRTALRNGQLDGGATDDFVDSVLQDLRPEIEDSLES